MNRIAMAIGIAACSFAPLTAIAADPQLAHIVFFKLTDNSAEAKQQLVSACNKYLAGHAGTAYYRAGVLAEDLQREVNDLDFDVSLTLVFRNKAAHGKYQTHPRHLKFIEENKDTWTNVRVFDSYLATPPADKKLSRRIPLPDPAAQFAGMIRGKVVQKRKDKVVVKVSEVTEVWKHSRAEDAEALIGKNVLVGADQNDMIRRFVSELEVGENTVFDVAHKKGEILTIVELTEEQRQRVDR